MSLKSSDIRSVGDWMSGSESPVDNSPIFESEWSPPGHSIDIPSGSGDPDERASEIGPDETDSDETDSEVEPTIQRHPQLYFEDGNVVIKVESTLFRVLRSRLVLHSPVFRDMFSLPQPGSGKSTEGSDDENPIVLEGVKSQEFVHLLSVIFPLRGPESEDSSAWISILSLSDRWQISQLRQLAVSCLKDCKLDPIKKLELKVQFSLDDSWAEDAYCELGNRDKPLSLAEAKKLDIDTVVEIARVREERLLQTLNSVHKRRR